MDNDMTAKKLICLRGDKTQQEVAADLDITINSIIDYEQGKRRPNDALKIKIADYFNVDVGWLFFCNNE